MSQQRPRPVAIVTGAGRGLGRAQAVALATHGFDLIVVERSAADETAGTAADVEAVGGRAAVVLTSLRGHRPLAQTANAMR